MSFVGLAIWPGISQVLRASFTLTQGITPSVCTLEIAPQSGPVTEHGTLTFTFADVTINFPNAKVDKASFQFTENGLLWQLSIIDRRWRWAYKTAITGNYNERRPNVQGEQNINNLGSIDARTVATPQQLAGLCLQAMGETGYDVSQLPNDSRPEIHWDHDNAAQALAELCDQLGCRVCLGLDSTVSICRAGVGATLPDTSVMRLSAVVDPPEAPEAIAAVGGKSRYQVDLLLEAVGLDKDGQIKLIDDLSYKPAEGWPSIEPGYFYEVEGWTLMPNVPPNLQNFLALGRINARELALQTIYRWYRIRMRDVSDAEGSPAGGGPIIPGWRVTNGNQGSRIQHRWQILPIEDEQVAGWYDGENTFQRFPAWVFGRFYAWDFGAKNTDPGSFCHFDYSIDRERGLVQFGTQVYRYGVADEGEDAQRVYPANLVLRTAVSVRDAATGVFDRFSLSLATSAAGTGAGTRTLQREEIILNVQPTYNYQTNAVVSTTTNIVECVNEATYAINAALLEYQTTTPLDVTFMGLVPIAVDGAITQVTWEVGPSGATTRVSRDTEWNPAVPTYRERRLIERLKRNNPKVQALQDQARRG